MKWTAAILILSAAVRHFVFTPQMQMIIISHTQPREWWWNKFAYEQHLYVVVEYSSSIVCVCQ